MPNNEQIIRDFIAAWSRLDSEELANYFTDDGVYHNMPMGPIAGKDDIRKFIHGFTAPWSETQWDIVSLLAAGDLVMVERVDRTLAEDKSVALPCVGVFEMEDGKIKRWRDYFDMQTYLDELG